MVYTAKDYSKLIGTEGFSETLLNNHFTLYQGYVTNTNKVSDILAGMFFGVIINILVLTVGLAFLNYTISILPLLIGIIFASLCFASLGVLLASPPVRSPSHIMMFSSLIRFPLIFMSGVFIPLEKLQGAGRVLSYFSPITYLVDILNFALKGGSSISLVVDFGALLGFSIIFTVLTNRFHQRNLMRGL